MNKQELEETLVKVQREPGLCTKEMLVCAHEFYTSLNKKLIVYAEVHNDDRFGGTVDFKLKDIQFYLDALKSKK